MYGDNPQARRRRNHNMVEKGVHAVPTLRNRVVIFIIENVCTSEVICSQEIKQISKMDQLKNVIELEEI